MDGASTFKNADKALRIASLGVALLVLHHFSNASQSDPGRNVIRSFMFRSKSYFSVPVIKAITPARRWLISARSPTWPQLIAWVSGAGRSISSSWSRATRSCDTNAAFSYAASALSFGLLVLVIFSSLAFRGLVPVGCRSSLPQHQYRNCRTVCKPTRVDFSSFVFSLGFRCKLQGAA